MRPGQTYANLPNMRSNSVKFKLFQASIIIWTILWAAGSLYWTVLSSPYCFGESSILKLYAYTAFQQGNCQELLHAPALFTAARPFIFLSGCTPTTFALLQTVIFLLYASLTAYIASILHGPKVGWLSFLLLTCSLGALQGLRTFLLDYPLAIPLLLLYIAYLKSADFKKPLPCLLFSLSLWLGAQTKYSFLPIWAFPICSALLGRSFYRALKSGQPSLIGSLSQAWHADRRPWLACLGSTTILFIFTLAAIHSGAHFHQLNAWNLTCWYLGPLAATLSATAAFYFVSVSTTLQSAWRRFGHGWAACCLGLSLVAWSYTTNLEAILTHTAANFSRSGLGGLAWLSNIPAAWLSYFSAVCQGDLLPFPWAFLVLAGLLFSLIRRRGRQRNIFWVATLIAPTLLLQILPWDHAYQRFFAPLLPWLAILAAYCLSELGLICQFSSALSKTLVLLIWLEAVAFSLAWICPSWSTYLPTMEPGRILGEGLSLNIPKCNRTAIVNLKESLHPFSPPTEAGPTNLPLNPFMPTFFTIQPLQQPWFDELKQICLRLSTLNSKLKRPLSLIILAELNNCELKGESPAMELRLWCAERQLSSTITIIGVNRPQDYCQAASQWPDNLTVLISNNRAPSLRLQHDVSPKLDDSFLLRKSQSEQNNLALLYYGSSKTRLVSRFLFPKSQEDF